MATRPRTRRRAALIVGSALLLVLALALTGAGYLNYRVNRFSDSVFRDEATPPQTQYGAATPTPETQAAAPTATATATATPEPTATQEAPRADPPAPATAVPDTPTPAPTPTVTIVVTPTPTPLPYGNSPVIRRLRAGERVSVLLLGFGGPGHDGGYLTDSLQVATFDPKEGVVTLISLPRDLWVYIPPFERRGGHWGKINEAYAVGMGAVDRDDYRVPYQKHDNGGRLASQVVAQVLGLPIDYWVSLDFVGFRKFIDALGGVDVWVERAFTDTQYPVNDDADIDPSYKTVHFDAGLQHLDGERAIQFARSRYAPEDGSDFGRARRQHSLMIGVKEQVFRVETLPRALSLLDALEGHLRTSLSFTEFRDLAGWAQELARDKRPINVRSAVLDPDELLEDATSPEGAYILLPQRGQGDYRAIQQYVRDRVYGTVSGTPGRPGTPGTPGRPGTPGTPSPTR